MSCMLVSKGIEHGLLHLNGMSNWRNMQCGGACSRCGSVDPGRATDISNRAFKCFLPNVNDHPGNPGTESGPRQPPTPPPSGVVEPPEPSNDQAKIKFWRDRAIQAEARLVERDRQLQQQGMEILE